MNEKAYTINEWEIWHTYTTFMSEGVDDIGLLARKLVETGVTPCAMTRDGLTFWRYKGEVAQGVTSVDINAKSSSASIHFPQGMAQANEEDGYILESSYQSGYFRFSEMKLFGSDLALPHDYIRIHPGKCIFVSNKDEKDYQLSVYPSIKIYKSGVVIIEYRMIGPKRSVPLREFIAEYVNAFQHEFNMVVVPFGLARMASVSATQFNRYGGSIRDRMRLLTEESVSEKILEEMTVAIEDDEFKFEYAPLTGEGGPLDLRDTFASFSQTIFVIIAYLQSEPRDGVSYLLRGQKPLVMPGSYWCARPHIYLTEFEEQQETASQNEERHRDAFAWILARTMGTSGEDPDRYLPKDTRHFEDYNAYITSAVTLWVWSKSGLESHRLYEDINRGHLIYEQQVDMEMLEYGYMLHRRLLEWSSWEGAVAEDIIKARSDLVELDQQLSEVSYSGEIRELLQAGWKEFGLDGVQKRTNELLAIRETETSLRESRVAERVGRAISILFGLLAVPTVAESVLRPVWERTGLLLPTDESSAELCLLLIALVLVGIPVWILQRKIGN